MATIKEEAKTYESMQTKNIAELDVVPISLEVVETTATDKDGKPFTVKTVTVDGEDYRVPNIVLKSLKAILQEKPDLKSFKVVRYGEGLKTTYTVIPL